MQIDPALTSAGPVEESARITSLDLIRGIAVLGILLMNAVHFKLGLVPYHNLSAGGMETWLDWTVGIFGEIFVDQKFMGLFSLLFGAGVMLFIDRAAARERHPIRLNLWRNALLLGIGIIHFLLWEGDVLMVYAIASVFLIILRRLSPKALIALGVIIFLAPVATDLLAQYIVNTYSFSLVGLWIDPGAEPREPVGLAYVFGYFMRGLGLILLGAGLYRLGFIQGQFSPGAYRLTAAVGLGVGLPLAALGVLYVVLNDFSRAVAFTGNIPNSLGTIPATLGYLSLIIRWSQRGQSRIKQRLIAVGRMALTNYLTQSILGVLILTVVLSEVNVNRSGILLFVLAVWALQLWWSQAWLNRFRFGPAEWLWRVATYRRGQPLRRV